ncbi:hypothetical protein KO498_10380 [Lentibacter algarum]|uniref:hypothetical protein n=1 Tax=Lentibacter algarum TaxID=576131 RepID=UPI001C072AD6|nr:hypothetical protein [Lentibacter algarum]MBU2982213.1 hypothetical protein [Lentibacter algarum]
MRIILTTSLVALLALPGCGGSLSESRVNPANWFGKSRGERVAVEQTNPLLPRRSSFSRPDAVYGGVPVAQILELQVERAAGGAVIRTKGLSPTLGAYDVRLEPVEYEEGEAPKSVLEFTLKAAYSKKSRPNAPASGREIVAAAFVSDIELEGIRTIRVIGGENARSVRR